jgi:hypothetical protein
MGMGRYEKQLRYQKSQSITTGVGKPGSSEGSNGAITIRNINGQVTLFGKYNGIWYGRDLGPTMIVGEKNMTHLSIDRKGINAMDGFTSLAHFGETLRIGPDSATKTAFRVASDGTASIGTSGTAKVTMSSAGVLTVTDILLSGRIGYVTGSTSKNILIGSVGGTSYPCPDVTDINTAYFLGNVVIGDDACQQVNVDASDVFRNNVAIGNNAMKSYDPVAYSSVVNSDSNVAIGHSAMQNFHQGLKNTAVGAGALLGANSTGSYNVCIGFDAGGNITSGSGNVVIGDSDVTTADGDNQLVIASGGAASPVTWLTGDSSGNVLVTGTQQLQFNDNSQHIASTANDMTITSEQHITLDAGSNLDLDGDQFIRFLDDGTHYGTLSKSAGTSLTITSIGNLNLTPASDDYVKLGGGTGFTQVTATYDALDTDIDFRDGNKQILTLTGNIVDVHFQFPAVSGNFLCIFLQDGTGGWDVNNWKTKNEAGSAGSGNSGVVKWAGGSATTLTETADKADIVSIYWDATNEMAYAVASENF